MALYAVDSLASYIRPESQPASPSLADGADMLAAAEGWRRPKTLWGSNPSVSSMSRSSSGSSLTSFLVPIPEKGALGVLAGAHALQPLAALARYGGEAVRVRVLNLLTRILCEEFTGADNHLATLRATLVLRQVAAWRPCPAADLWSSGALRALATLAVWPVGRWEAALCALAAFLEVCARYCFEAPIVFTL